MMYCVRDTVLMCTAPFARVTDDKVDGGGDCTSGSVTELRRAGGYV